MVSFRNRSSSLDEVSEQFLKLLVALGEYCPAVQAQELIARGTQVRARLKDAGAAWISAADHEISRRFSGDEVHDSPAGAGFKQPSPAYIGRRAGAPARIAFLL